MRRLIVGLFIVVSTFGRAHAGGKTAPPSDLLATVALGPETTLDGARSFIDTVKPGSGAVVATVPQLIAKAVGAGSLTGIDPKGWSYLLLSDDGTTKGMVMLVPVRDARALTAAAKPAQVTVKGAWAVIGAKPLVDHVATYAFTVAPTLPRPSQPTAIVNLPAVLTRYNTAAVRQQLVAAAASPNGATIAPMLEGYYDGMLALANDSEQVIVTLDMTKDLGAIDLTLVPKVGSRLATFIALQKPADLALLDKLPAVAAPMMMVGHLDMGPYRDGLFAMAGQMYGVGTSATGGAAKDLIGAVAEVVKATNGDFAMTMTMTPGHAMTIDQVFGLTDMASADKAIARALDLFKAPRTMDALKIKSTIKATAPTTYDHITLRGYEIKQDLASVPAEERKAMEAMMPGGVMAARIATFDGVGVVAIGSDSVAEAKHVIDAARGKATHYTPSREVTSLLDTVRVRKESFGFVIDVGALAARLTSTPAPGSEPILMSMGYADHNAHIRFAITAATLKLLAKL